MLMDFPDPRLWDTPFPSLRNRTPRQLLAGDRENDPVMAGNFSGLYAERLLGHLMPWLCFGNDGMNTQIISYWKKRGIRKEMHVNRDEPDKTWVAYLPELAVEKDFKCPIVFIDHAKGRDLLDIEAWGFVQLAAEKQYIVLSVEEGNHGEIVWETIKEAARRYPVDLRRVYLVGHSFSGTCAGRIAVANPERYAGLCMLGSQYSGLDSTPEEIAMAGKLGMPRIDVHGTAEKILPFNITHPIPASPKVLSNVTPTDMGLEACYHEQMFWRSMNKCRLFDITEMAAIQENSSNIVEREIGTFLDRTELRVLGLLPHYLGDAIDQDGQAIMRYVGVEGAPHYPSAYAGELAWEFLSRFSRDAETGALAKQ